ncbi:MAG TPA: hypothetical protein VMU05_02090 [Dongiaceae bacterium]|nr:hypothetical protein [Dongiaceae bacterium]
MNVDRLLVFSISVLACLSGVFGLAQSSVDPKQPQLVTVRDGTAIHLRFAERVCNAVSGLHGRDIATRRGATVRFVVTRDLRVGDKVVVAQGEVAQASVTKVWTLKPYLEIPPSVFPGVFLEFDWVTTVTGERAWLRATRKGRAKAFPTYMLLTPSGADVRAWRWSEMLHEWGNQPRSRLPAEEFGNVCIPSGARMVAYLDGDLNLSGTELAEAQDTLPIPNEAILYVFRLRAKKDEAGPSPSVFCNRVEVGGLAPQQMAITNLPPGKYSCRIGDQAAIDINVEAGREYYAQLRRKGQDKWTLSRLAPEDGEDLSAETAVVAPEPTASSQR